MDALSESLTHRCNRCQVGRQHLKMVTFFTWIGDETITVPNFPAWVCDMCGYRLYDRRAMDQLSLVLNPDVGQPVIPPYIQLPGSPPSSLPPI